MSVKKFEVRLATRPIPRCERYPHGVPSTVETAVYEEHELEHAQALMEAVRGGDAAAANELACLHELKVLLPGSRFLRPTEQERWDETRRPVGETTEERRKVNRERAKVDDAAQTTLVAPEGTSSLFEAPKKAKKDAVVERDNAAEYDGDLLSDPTADRAFITHPSTTPETQQRAAMSALPRTGSDKMRVLLFLYEEDERGATDWEIERALGMKHQTASARRYDLAKGGWIVESGVTRKTDTGNDAAVWVLSAEGRINFDQLRVRKAEHDRSRAV